MNVFLQKPENSVEDVFGDSKELADMLRAISDIDNGYVLVECAEHIEGMYFMLIETEKLLNELREYLLAHNTIKH